MRTALILIALASFASAEDAVPEALERFESALLDLRRADAVDSVTAALDALVALRDERCAEALARALLASYARETAMLEQIVTVGAREQKAKERLAALGRELELLDVRARSGARGLGPEMEKRKAEGRRLVKIATDAGREAARIRGALMFLLELREKLAAGCAQVVRGLENDAVSNALAKLREILPVSERGPALYLVRILRDSRKPEAVPHLSKITLDAEIPAAVVRASASALARFPGKGPAETLLRLWERDAERYGAHVRYLLSRRASRPLADLAQARAWVEQQQ